MNWTIERGPANGAIMPNFVVVALGEGGVASTHLFVGREKMRAFVMAITPGRLLVGRQSGFALPGDFDYNAEAARLSHSFFLSPRSDDETARLHAMIGERLRPTLEEAVERGFDELLPEGVERRGGIEGESDHRRFGWRPASGGRFELSLVPWGGEAARVQSEVTALVGDLESAPQKLSIARDCFQGD